MLEFSCLSMSDDSISPDNVKKHPLIFFLSTVLGGFVAGYRVHSTLTQTPCLVALRARIGKPLLGKGMDFEIRMSCNANRNTHYGTG
jgi:hypothetical protein